MRLSRYRSLIMSGLASVALISGCSQLDSITSSATQQQSGVDVKDINPHISPGDNFFDYVNGTWLESHPIPEDKKVYGSFTILADKARDDVHKIIIEAQAHPAKQGTAEQQMADLYQSFMATDILTQKGLKPIAPLLASTDHINQWTSLADAFAKAWRQGSDAPFVPVISVDSKDPDHNITYLTQSGLGLPDRDYYLEQDASSKALRSQYLDYMTKVLTLAQIPTPSKSAQTILKLETRIAKAQWDRVSQRDRIKTYNKVTVPELVALMPAFPWHDYLKQAGLEQQKHFIVSEPSYLQSLNQVMLDTPLADWRLYLKWQQLNSFASYLSPAMDQLQFSFYGTQLQGVPLQKARWIRGTELVSSVLGEAVGKQYVKAHFSPEAKARVEELVENLRTAYADSIKKLDWMGPETKKQALAKLAKFQPKIGYPNKWRDYSALVIKADDLFGNMIRAQEFEVNYALAKLEKPVDKNEWEMTPQTVNAYYHPDKNEIVFPAAILQPPFFNPNADEAVNYGAIGGVIGHEMGHGFDDQGAKSDGEGRLRNWWTEKDMTEFHRRTEALVKQYDNYEPLPGEHINGKLTLGENIGDLGGLSMAYKAYHLALKGKTAPVMDGFTGDQRFFIGWAQVWRIKYRPQFLSLMLKTDPHSPAQYRVNGVVANIPAFYTAFKVKPGQKLYRSPEELVKIW